LTPFFSSFGGPSAGYQGRKKLTTMVIPSIFVPEDWSFTFYEGLNRHPDSIFKDKSVAELGCGNGWISIAIAEKWLPSKVGSFSFFILCCRNAKFILCKFHLHICKY
jgi:hypothetical protein